MDPLLGAFLTLALAASVLVSGMLIYSLWMLDTVLKRDSAQRAAADEIRMAGELGRQRLDQTVNGLLRDFDERPTDRIDLVK